MNIQLNINSEILFILSILLLLLNIGIIGYFIFEKIKKKPIIKEIPKKELFDDYLLFENNQKIDDLLNKRLAKVFDRLIQRKYLLIYKKFNNLSDENIKNAKRDFIEACEVEFSAKEKEFLSRRFETFLSFKLFMTDFFSDRINKFQFVMTFGMDLGEIFSDIKIYKDISNETNTESNIIKILEKFNN